LPSCFNHYWSRCLWTQVAKASPVACGTPILFLVFHELLVLKTFQLYSCWFCTKPMLFNNCSRSSVKLLVLPSYFNLIGRPDAQSTI
jgi:hypothetical protein